LDSSYLPSCSPDRAREVAKQTRITNSIAGASALNDLTNNLGQVFLLFVERPELRAYFYDCKPCPRRATQRNRVIAVADLLADVLECGLVAARLIPSSESYEDWSSYAQYMLAHSPVLEDLIRKHPTWWPQLVLLLP
jgi:hypothetical protein